MNGENENDVEHGTNHLELAVDAVLRKTYQQAAKERDALREKVAALEDWKAKANARVGELRRNLSRAHERVSKAEDEVAALEERCKTEVTKACIAEQEKDRLGEKADALEQERDALRAELANWTTDHDLAEADLKDARAELARLKPSGQVAEDVEAIREMLAWPCPSPDDCEHCTAHATLSRLAALAQQAQELRRHMPEVEGLTPYERCVAGTCGHEDAGRPGHADRVKERSEAFTAAIDSRCARCSTSPERVTLCSDCFHRAKADYAEAMRAACWEVVQGQLDRDGVIEGSHMWSRYKTAIEGVAP